MSVSLSRAACRWTCLVLCALALVLSPARWTPSADASPLQTAASHPYGDPVWFPLRSPAEIGCAKSECGSTDGHGYWAIDFLADRGEPVYAAGAGIAHVGGNSGSCSGSGDVGGGRWVWVDHGGGVVSRYHHLDSITIADGQLVTPATQIGTVGHSGDVPPCTTNYLHFEVRQGGIYGERVDFGSLAGCTSRGTVRLPEYFGYSSWDDRGLHPVKRLVTPALDSSCIDADWLTTADRSLPATSRADRSITVAVTVPAGSRSWTADLEIWRPTLNAWKPLESRTIAATTGSTTFIKEVENNRAYRVRTATHNGSGWSAWSPMTEVTSAPGAPGVRYLSWKRTSSSTKSYLHYGWNRPAEYGSAVRSYTVARRCGSATATLGGWTTKTVSRKTFYKNLDKLGRAKVCEVKIQATNAIGTGPWSTARTVRR